MTLHYHHIEAVETRLRWLRWSKSEDGRVAFLKMRAGFAFSSYQYVLENGGDTFCMEERFCQLVDEARASVPGDLAFDMKWLLAPSGFLWLATPFRVPRIAGRPDENPVIRAIGWSIRGGRLSFMTFLNLAGGHGEYCEGFGPWSQFTLDDEDRLVNRIENFEQTAPGGDQYLVDRGDTTLHEIRWIYAAFHMMAQRLAISVTHDVDRATRRRAEREGHTPPQTIRAITLRRLQQDRHVAGPAGERPDWQWQWIVTGFWRNQWFPSAKTHKPVFIESYLKGPKDKPIKPETQRLYVARR